MVRRNTARPEGGGDAHWKTKKAARSGGLRLKRECECACFSSARRGQPAGARSGSKQSRSWWFLGWRLEGAPRGANGAREAPAPVAVNRGRSAKRRGGRGVSEFRAATRSGRSADVTPQAFVRIWQTRLRLRLRSALQDPVMSPETGQGCLPRGQSADCRVWSDEQYGTSRSPGRCQPRSCTLSLNRDDGKGEASCRRARLSLTTALEISGLTTCSARDGATRSRVRRPGPWRTSLLPRCLRRAVS